MTKIIAICTQSTISLSNNNFFSWHISPAISTSSFFSQFSKSFRPQHWTRLFLAKWRLRKSTPIQSITITMTNVIMITIATTTTRMISALTQEGKAAAAVVLVVQNVPKNAMKNEAGVKVRAAFTPRSIQDWGKQETISAETKNAKVSIDKSGKKVVEVSSSRG